MHLGYDRRGVGAEEIPVRHPVPTGREMDAAGLEAELVGLDLHRAHAVGRLIAITIVETAGEASAPARFAGAHPPCRYDDLQNARASMIEADAEVVAGGRIPRGYGALPTQLELAGGRSVLGHHHRRL